jgi:myosin heavy subunit
MNMNMARDVKDALVKGIYGRLFVWIVEKVNSTVNKTKGKIRGHLRSPDQS